MLKKNFVTDKVRTVVQAGFVYAWLTVLSPLSATDTYYSVYLLCAVMGLLCLYDNYRMGHQALMGQKIVMAVLAVIFSTAVLLANYPLFSPLSVLQNLFDAVCVFAGGCTIGYQILLCLLKRLPMEPVRSARLHPGRVFWLVFGSIAAIDLGYLMFSLYPGVLTTDSFSTIAQILGEQPYNNIMPFWHTVTVEVFVNLGLRLFGDINGGIALFHTAQILFIAACFGYAIVTMYQMGVPVWFMASVYAIYAFMPHNIAYSVTLWKDIPFAGAALLFVTAFYRLLKNIGKFRWLNYVVLVVGAVGFSLWRTNGWYAFLAMTLLMLILLRKEHRKLLILMVLVLVLCWVMINPVLDALSVGETNFVEAFGIPMQQIARVVYNDRQLTQEETALLSELFLLDRMKELYDPQTVDPIKFNTFHYQNVDYLMENLGDYVALYFRIGLRYPGDYLKAWIEATKGYWNGGYKFWTYTLQMGENSYGIVQRGGDNVIARLYAALFRYLEKPAILQPLTSIGLHVWALVSCCVVAALQKRKEFLLTVPVLVLIVGLWLGTPVFAEFRYAYPMFLTMPMILAATCWRTGDEMEPLR